MLILATSYAQDYSIEGSRLLHESIVLNLQWTPDRGPDLCNMDKFKAAIQMGGDVNSPSDIYTQREGLRQNVFNRAIAYTCKEIAHLILDKYAPKDPELLAMLVNDPQRSVLKTSPLNRTINKNYVDLFTRLINDFPVKLDLAQISKKLGNKNRTELAKALIDSGRVTSLNQLFQGIKRAIIRENPEVLEVFLNYDPTLKPLDAEKRKKLKELALEKTETIKNLIQ